MDCIHTFSYWMPVCGIKTWTYPMYLVLMVATHALAIPHPTEQPSEQTDLPVIVRRLPVLRPPIALSDSPPGLGGPMGLLNMIMGSDYDIPRDPFSNKHQDEADTATVPSSALAAMFPGQFFSRASIRALAGLETGRMRRELDMDVCCRTDVWFGTAPDELVDVDGLGPWPLLKNEDRFQAYSRGDCHDEEPHHGCPSEGQCRQKTRLHMLWVRNGTQAELKYFRVNSHCAFERARP